jgi:hypothetical protein
VATEADQVPEDSLDSEVAIEADQVQEDSLDSEVAIEEDSEVDLSSNLDSQSTTGR